MTDLVLVKLDQARLLLSEARTVQDAKQIFDVAEAARAYARHANLSAEAVNYAAEIKIRAERLLGEMLQQTERAPGKRTDLVPKKNQVDAPPTLAEIGITKKQSSRAQHLASLPAETIEQHIEAKKARGDEITASGLIKDVRRKEREQERDIRRTLADGPGDTDTCQLLCADISLQPALSSRIAAIITDPPYPRDYLSVYGDLARWAAEWLQPGGSMLVMIGQSYLPEILALMTPHIRYHWTLSYLTPGGQSAQLWQRKVNTFWKPVLWFVNGDYDGPWTGDVTRSAVNDNDKRFHSWGQSESGIADLVERFTKPGDLVCDPFCGGGTTGAVALQLGRQFIGLDSDPDAITTTRKRLGNLEYAR